MEDVPSQDILNRSVTITVLNKAGKQIDQFMMRGGTNLWVFLRKRGLPIGAACSGVGVCGACSLKISSTHANAVSEKNSFEIETLKRNAKPQRERLACLCRIYHDVTVQSDYW